MDALKPSDWVRLLRNLTASGDAPALFHAVTRHLDAGSDSAAVSRLLREGASSEELRSLMLSVSALDSSRAGLFVSLAHASEALGSLQRSLEGGERDPGIIAGAVDASFAAAPPVGPESLRRLVLLLEEHGDAAGELEALDRIAARGPPPNWMTRRRQRLLGRPFAPATADGTLAGRLATTLVYPHAYKTGGTSLSRGLAQVVGAENWLKLRPISTPHSLEELTEPDRRRLDLVTGHFRGDFAEDVLAPLLPKPTLYVGVVREPVSRLKSIYSYFLTKENAADEGDHRLRVRFDPDLNVVARRWLEASDDWAAWRHDQCRVICGLRSFSAAAEAIGARYLAVVTPSAINGLVAAVAKALDAPVPKPLHQKRTGSEALSIDPDLESALRRDHREDAALHQWVAERQQASIEHAADRLRELVLSQEPAERIG